MSFSNPTITTPAQKFFRWKSDEGSLIWYDKEAEKEFPIKAPFRFVVLDQLHNIKGYSDTAKSGIWSNEVRSLKRDTLHVKSKSGDIATGIYEKIKDRMKAEGGKFAASVYIAYQQAVGEDGEWQIANISFTGGALGEWFDFQRKHNIQVHGVTLTGSREEKNGAVKFKIPTFETFNLDTTVVNEATRLDKELQKYLKQYLEQKHEEDEAKAVVTAEELADDVNDDSDRPVNPESKDVVLEDIDDKPIDLSEIPF